MHHDKILTKQGFETSRKFTSQKQTINLMNSTHSNKFMSCQRLGDKNPGWTTKRELNSSQIHGITHTM